MGRIHVLSEHVINKIAAGEVVERPASVVKELLENSLDAGCTRIRVNIEAGGKKLIQIIDDGCGMVQDDALLAFERHATSKIRNDSDLVTIGTLGFRGEALSSIAAISRLRLETRAPEQPSGTIVEIAGGKILTVDEAGLPAGTSITVRDLFFNTPARRKFLKADSTELAHIASLVTHYALAHPDKHWELHSTTNAMLVAAPVATHAERIYQVFGKETLDQLLPVAAVIPLQRMGLLPRPLWSNRQECEPQEAPSPGELRVRGFVSKPEVQKLNRNSIFIFVNGRLIRDRLIQHALTEAYRNILPPTVFPVVLLFLEMPHVEVDVNVHPSKTEVRFRQQSFIHDFVRDTVRSALMDARPAPQFAREIHAEPTSAPALSPQIGAPAPAAAIAAAADTDFSVFSLVPQTLSAVTHPMKFNGDAITVEANAAVPVARFAPPLEGVAEIVPEANDSCGPRVDDHEPPMDLTALESLRPLGQIKESFILAVNGQGLWIIDQHACHERVLFERILLERQALKVECQRLLMPIIVELTPAQLAVFAEISGELERNGFEAEPFGARTIAVKTSPAGVQTTQVEHLLSELIEQFEREDQALDMEKIRARIAASIACHAAIKVNMPLEQNKMEWLLSELAQTQYPMTCPHGRPVVLRYSVKDIQKAFKRI
ncbi:MAG TPA: DNA mismatch repair endonuclease MutL [Clostridia bacterium]|nr:DNA mismatch repair endonuclease MutL [Clostridia bacterium]